jgi:hypothetical protein
MPNLHIDISTRQESHEYVSSQARARGPTPIYSESHDPGTRMAAPAAMSGHENDPRSSNSVDKRRSRMRSHAPVSQGSPLTTVAQRGD